MVFESFLAYSRLQTETAPKLTQSSAASLGYALDGRLGDFYNEEAFRHLLEIERARAERSDCSFLLLLVRLGKCPEHDVRVSREVGPTLLSGLSFCVREVDFVGWYREGRVAGAVLAQGLDIPGSDAPARIVERVTHVLSQRLPAKIASRLRVRVVKVDPRAK
jgi:hypothetical protein